MQRRSIETINNRYLHWWSKTNERAFWNECSFVLYKLHLGIQNKYKWKFIRISAQSRHWSSFSDCYLHFCLL